MKFALCLAGLSLLSLAGCAATTDTDSTEDVDEAAEASCPLVIMPTVDQSLSLDGTGDVGHTVSAHAVSTDSYYDPDNFTVEITYPGRPNQSAYLSNWGGTCGTLTATFWVHNASTGCWQLYTGSTTTGGCAIGMQVPAGMDRVRVSGNNKSGSTFLGVEIGGGWHF